MDTSGTITEGGKATCTLDKFRQPRILSMADASAIENTKRLSFWAHGYYQSTFHCDEINTTNM